MTDPWDEKPHSRKPGSLPYNIKVYDAEVMDPWLEQLKAHYEPIEEKAENYDKGVIEHKITVNTKLVMQSIDGLKEAIKRIEVELEQKLEAIKKYIINLRDVPERTMMTTSTIADILEKLLEGEG